jgi:hypothetical protein
MIRIHDAPPPVSQNGRHRREGAGLVEQDALLQQEAERLAGLSAENRRLSELAKQAEGHSPVHGPPAELLKLRGEIAVLQQLKVEAERLRTTNQQLKGAGADPGVEESGPPPEAAVLVRWPRDQLAFAGAGGSDCLF